MEISNNLPIKANQSLSSKVNKISLRAKEIAKKVGKCAFYGGITLVGLGASAIGTLPVAIAGFGVLSVGLARGYQNLFYRNQPDLMFSTRKVIHKNSTQITQDALRLDIMNKIKDFNTMEKGSLMALQTLVGLQRYKKELENTTKFQTDTPEINVYPKKFHTTTHGINIKNMEVLEKLGYIQIDRENIDNNTKKKLLIVERLGFGEFKTVGDIAKAAIKGDKEFVEKNKKEFRTIEFRLTDKPINFQELYELCNDRSKDNKLRTPARRLAPIFDKKYGLLKTKKIDIEIDKCGMPKIIYNAEKSFVQKNETVLDKENLQERVKVEEFTNEKQAEVVKKFLKKEKSCEEKNKENERT